MTITRTEGREPSAEAPAGTKPAPADALVPLLQARMAGLSRAEQKIASHLLDHAAQLHLETGASIARAVGVSEMTVGRFVRSLGFDNLRALKRKVAAGRPVMPDPELARAGPVAPLEEGLAARLEADLDAVARAYALARQPHFEAAIRAMERAASIHVTGTPAVRGLAFDLASRLLWTKPGVVFDECGQETGLFAEGPSKALLLLVCPEEGAERCRRLAALAQAAKIPLIVITDSAEPWAWSHTPWVLEARATPSACGASRTGMHVLAGLLLEALAARLGERARRHYRRMLEAAQAIEGIGEKRKTALPEA